MGMPHLKIFPLGFALFLLALSISQHPAHSEDSRSDPLFAKMAGQWAGQGERVFAPHGRKVRFAALVEAHVVDGRLISTNQIRETPTSEPDLPAKEYTRVYWLKAHPERRGA